MGEARDFIKKYFTAFPNIQPFMDKVLAKAHEDGYVETIFSRRRYFKNINSPNKMLQKEEERQAFNTPLQGTAADIIKKAMIELYARLEAEHPETKIILQVHDELVIECPREKADTIATLTQEVMQNIVKLKVPLTVDVAIGDNWLEAA
jgi:DNA polymerase-1